MAREKEQLVLRSVITSRGKLEAAISQKRKVRKTNNKQLTV